MIEAAVVSILLVTAAAIIVRMAMFLWRMTADERRYTRRLKKGFRL
jgi:hypothetical protein